METVYKIIHRTKEYFSNPFCAKYFNVTEKEIQMLETIKDFRTKIYELSPNVYYYNGYFLPANQFETSVFLYKHGMHTLRTLDKIKQKDIIDVGGFIGDSAIVFQEFTNKTIHTFEAVSSHYELLLKTLELNNATRIKPVKKALGSVPSMAEINIQGIGSSMVINYGQTKEAVEIITLDSYVKENNVEVGFIKVDIEGFEMEFIKGAKETICTQKPAMLISIYHQASDFFDIKPLLESWNLGYKFYIYHPCEGSISEETALFCEVV
ncbi:SAM-dependent methyltransferase [Helicobacter sp. CLO-3]|nr:SAM-dependent methyltransferase [Helicobacter sp. CLO-3]OHU84164.1 SAM-dependent methyltransferase [Helicobacter sp. CLO-3]